MSGTQKSLKTTGTISVFPGAPDKRTEPGIYVDIVTGEPPGAFLHVA